MRDIEVYLHDEVLQDLIAVHFQSISLIKSSEEVNNLTIGPPNKEGVRAIRFNIEPLTQTIIL